MKTFAVMLLMLCSYSFLKAQTMVVETGDTVESFEIGKIQKMHTYSQSLYHLAWIRFNNIPVSISGNQKFNYTVYQNTSRGNFYLVNDTLRVMITSINFNLIDKEYGSSSSFNSMTLVLDSTKSIIRYLHFPTSGSRSLQTETGSIYGEFDLILEDIPFVIDSNEFIQAVIKNKDIPLRVQKLFHREERRTKEFPSAIQILNIREEDLTDDSQIIITIE